MALSYTVRQVINLGSVTGRLVRATPGTSDYPTGGYPVAADASKLGFAIVHAVLPIGSSALARPLAWDAATGKLKVYRRNLTENTDASYTQNATTANFAEEANGADLTGDAFELLVLGV